MKRNPTKQQIGRCGELLVQLQLLKEGVESSQMTTDTGVDLVAYSSSKKKAITIQVKSNLRPKPAGGRGRLVLDWWAPEEARADLYAFVDLENEDIWLMNPKELGRLAQQNSNGRYHFYMVVDPAAKRFKDNKKFRKFEFEKYRLQNRIERIFG